MPRTVASAAGRGEDVELIIVDDGSTDDTAQVAESLIQQYPDVKYVFQDHQGTASARNFGIRISQGDYIIFLKPSDELTDAAISVVLMAIDENPDAEFFVSSYLSLGKSGAVEELRLRGFTDDPATRFKNFLMGDLKVYVEASVSRRSLFLKFQYPEQYHSDTTVAVFAWSLLAPVCVRLSVPLMQVNRAFDDQEHSIESIKGAGMGIVDTVFESEIVPEKLQELKRSYAARRALLLFGICYQTADFSAAERYFKRAMREDVSSVFELTYLAKYFRMNIVRLFRNQHG